MVRVVCEALAPQVLLYLLAVGVVRVMEGPRGERRVMTCVCLGTGGDLRMTEDGMELCGGKRGGTCGLGNMERALGMRAGCQWEATSCEAVTSRQERTISR